MNSFYTKLLNKIDNISEVQMLMVNMLHFLNKKQLLTEFEKYLEDNT